MDFFIDSKLHHHYARSPLVLVDVGASGGLKHTWKGTEKHLQVISFEPDERAPRVPSEREILYLNSGLYRERTSVDFYQTRSQGTSSMLEPNREFLDRFPHAGRFDVLSTQSIAVDTLDTQIREHGVDDVDFIKIDTQGSELWILQGAAGVLDGTALGLEVEVEFAPMYREQPLFSDVDQFIRKFGFELFDLGTFFWKRGQDGRQRYGKRSGQIIFADALYLANLETISRRIGAITDKDRQKSKVLKALSISVLYGYTDYALEILSAMNGVLDPDEQALAKRGLERDVTLSRRLPNFPARGKLATLAGRLYNVLRPPTWAAVEGALGRRD